MIYRKIPSLLLFIFASAVIISGGYQCATRVTHEGTEIIPIVNGGNNANLDDNDLNINDDDTDSRLPEEPDDGCDRDQYSDFVKIYGEMGVLKFKTNLEDYRLGREKNFGIKCPRIYLSMNRVSSDRPVKYRGQLAISYEADGEIRLQKYKSGSGASENRYNSWSSGSWRAVRGKVDKEFQAIFENEHLAIILKMEDVRTVDLEDGVVAYKGAGKIYYKMFRIWSGNTNDVCYSEGTYVSQARRRPPKRNRCWLITTGPFSCRPNGVLNPRESFSDIDLTEESFNCYSHLGNFFNVNIEEAFNADIEDI